MSGEENESRVPEEEILADVIKEWKESLSYQLIVFISRSAGRGRKRSEREVVLVKRKGGKGGEVHYTKTKHGLKPVKKRRGSVIIDDLMNETGTDNPDDALDKLREG
jgi:hypothetical protein